MTHSVKKTELYQEENYISFVTKNIKRDDSS